MSGSSGFIVAPGATVYSVKGWGSSSGGSAAAGVGMAVDVVFTVTDIGPQPIGVSVGKAGGLYAEGHSFGSYSFVLYDPQK